VEVGQAPEEQETTVERHGPLRAASLSLAVMAVAERRRKDLTFYYHKLWRLSR
jgi:hypothetical protein